MAVHLPQHTFPCSPLLCLLVLERRGCDEAGGDIVQDPKMKIRRMGRTGLKVSEICLGTMTFGHQSDERTSFAILDRATAAGVTFIDTADAYPVPPTPETAGRTEEIIGKWLRG